MEYHSRFEEKRSNGQNSTQSRAGQTKSRYAHAARNRSWNGLQPEIFFSDTHNRLEKGGYAREVTVRELPISKSLASVNMRLKPGAIRELHWHKEAEWAYMIYGEARITSVDAEGRNFTEDVTEGDLWYFPSGLPHSIQALEPGAEFLLVFDDGSFSENSTFQVTDWLAHTPEEVVLKNFGMTKEQFDKLPEKEKYIFQKEFLVPLNVTR